LAHFKPYVLESDFERESRQASNRSSLDSARDPRGEIFFEVVPFFVDCCSCRGYSFRLSGGKGGYADFIGESSIYYCSSCRWTFSYRFYSRKRVVVEPSGVSVGVGKVP
jgi:hypothetical protein